jgi:hypothetical protein
MKSILLVAIIGVVTIVVIAGIVSYQFMVAHAEPVKTFNDCYNDYLYMMYWLSLLAKSNYTLNDPTIKTFVTNLCNFYHEKTGIWVTLPLV